MATTTTTTTAATAAERGRTIRLLVDDSTGHVVVAEAGEDAVTLIRSVYTDPRAAIDEMLREDPALTAATSYAGLSAFDTLPPWGAPAPAAASSVAVAAAGKSARRGIMAWRLFRCDHLGCRCSDVASRTPGSACPCARCAAADSAGSGRRYTELDFIEACFYRRPDGSAVTRSRGGNRCGDTFYRCPARDGSRGRGHHFLQCRYRVTDERGVRCPLCHGLTSVEVKCAKGDGGAGGEPSAYRYAILDDLTVVKPIVVVSADDDAGLGVAALLSAVGVTAEDPAALRQVDVAFGYKEGLRMIWASLHSKAVLTDVFRSAVAGAAGHRRHRRR